MVTVAKRKQVDGAFGGRLRDLRLKAGLTQEQLGEKIGMNDVGISRLENGTVPTWPTAVKLAKALGVSLDAFAQASAAEPAVAEPGEPGSPPTSPIRVISKRK